MTQHRTLPTRKAFVDTGGYFALLDEDDKDHARAVAIYERLVAERWQLLTSNYVLTETHALLLNRLNQRIATRFLRDMEQSRSRIIWVTRGDIERAHFIIYQYDDKAFSLTDATSFAIMERLGITAAFAFDRHFAQYSFTLLTPDQFGER